MAEKYHFDSLDIVAACDKAFSSLLKEFDPQSEYYSKEMSSYIRERYKGVLVGIGVDLIVISDTATIANVAEGSPAEAIGLRIGDRISAIDLISTVGMKREDVLALLQGDEGTKIDIEIRKFPTRKIEKHSISRLKYDSPSVGANFVIAGTRVAYILLNRVSEKTPTEFAEALNELNKSDYDYFLLDLRNNPGGYLGQSAQIADEFLEKGQIICRTQSKTPEYDSVFAASGNGTLKDMPLVIMMDSNSASGAEVIAGAMQDNDRGLVVGMSSYGKASAQKFFNIADSSSFRITVAHYETPLGRAIQKNLTSAETVELDQSARLHMDDEKFSQINEMIQKHGGKTNMPIFKTPKGRTVIGGGGIVPDYFVNYDTTTTLTRVLRAKAIMMTWAMYFIENNYEKFENEYKTFELFDKTFNFTNDDIVHFANFCVANNIWNAEMFKIDRNYILFHLKALIAYVKWGSNEYNKVMVRTDPFVKKSIKIMNESKALIK
ncbi:MAG: S41 family peptidase [Candidatus Kapabacteria bacterium]|nr:S41 family peptidase [Candidatus Kapabacteria bacterium]